MQSKRMRLINNLKLFFIITVLLLICILFCGCIDVYERSPVNLIAISPDGSGLISIDHETVIQIWNITLCNELHQFDWTKTAYITTGPIGVKWFPDNNRFSVMDSIHIRIFQISDFSEEWNSSGGFSYIDTSKEGGIFATSFGAWDLFNYSIITNYNISAFSSKISLSPNGRKLAYLPKSSNSLQIIDTLNNSIIQNFESTGQNITKISSCNALLWSEDENRIAMVANYKNEMEKTYFYLWNSSEGSLIHKNNYSIRTGSADLSPDGTRFISGNLRDWNLTVINAFSGDALFELFVSKRGVSSVDWSPDGSLIAAGSNDGIIKVWNATTGELIQTMMTPKDHRVPT